MTTRIEVSAASPNTVYLLRANNDGGGSYGGVYKSTNSGSNFSAAHTSPGLFDFEMGGGSTQTWWNISFAVSQTNANEVHVGGKVNFVSTNGGSSFTQTSRWTWGNNLGYTHADQQSALAIGGTVYIGSDGMLVKTTNAGSTYTNITEGLGLRQHNKIGILQSATDEIVGGGSQDNGTSFYKNGTWYEWLGADGCDFVVSQTNKNNFFGCTQNGQSVHRSTNGGGSQQSATVPGSGGGWVVPMDDDAQGNVYMGYSSIHKSSNGSSWSTISVGGSGSVVHFDVARSNSNYIYAVKNSGVYMTSNGGSMSNITGSIPVGQSRPTSIAVHPTNPQRVAVCLSGYSDGNKVYVSTNGGSSWTNVSHDLPNVPCGAVCWQEDNNGLYVGTDIGMYYIDDNLGSSWASFNNGFPRTLVRDIEINYLTKKIYVATYGRGAWKGDLFDEAASAGANFSANYTNVLPGELIEFTDKSFVPVGSITSWSWSFPGGTPSSSTSQNPTVKYMAEGQYNVSLTITTSEGETKEVTKNSYINVSADIQMATKAIETCLGRFYDEGITAEYTDMTDFTMTFTSNDPNSPIQFDFQEFDVEDEPDCGYDYLEIRNGNSANAPLIGKYCGTNSPGVITSSNPENALTFIFHSDEAVTAPGWVAEITCPLSSGISLSPFSPEELTLFPNPVVGDELKLGLSERLMEKANQVTILSTTGSVVYAEEYQAQNGQVSIPVQHLANGTYYVTVFGTNGALTKTFQIQR